MRYPRQIIDGHYHILEGWCNGAGEDFVTTTRAYLDSRGFETLNICAVPFLEEYHTDVSNNILAALAKVKMPELYIHGGIYYDQVDGAQMADPAAQYRQLMDIGFDGIKMLETKPSEIKQLGRAMDDPFYEDWFAAIERDGTHMVWHVADPAHFWIREYLSQELIDLGWYYGDGTYPSQEEIYRQVLTVLQRHPLLKVTLAHFFFMADTPERLEEIFRKYPNVNVDITPGGEMYIAFGRDPVYWREFFTKYADRIGFGTDSDENSWRNPEIGDMVYDFLTKAEAQNIWDIMVPGIALDDEPLKKIFRGNFLRRVGSTPKPINCAALKAYIEENLHRIVNPDLRKQIEKASLEL